MFNFKRKAPPQAATVVASSPAHPAPATAAEIKLQEVMLNRSALQDAMVKCAGFLAIATDEKGVIQIFNAGAERMLGYAAHEVVNLKTPADICDPQEVAARAKALSEELGAPISPGFGSLVYKASRGMEDIFEKTYLRKDGGRFPAIVSVSALRDAKSKIIGYLLIGIDNTTRLRVEGDQTLLLRTQKETIFALERAAAEADAANLAKSQFLTSVSHELRAPLNAILGFAQLLGTDTPPLPASQRASVDQILHAGWYLLERLDEILDLAAIEAGTLVLATEPVSLAAVLRDCRALVEAKRQKHGITLNFPGVESRDFVRGDHTRIRQVLINLLNNAIAYNQPGGMVAVECGVAAGGRIRLSVRDTGAGLSPAAQRELFQMPRPDTTPRGADRGLGIGLAMSKRLVELMGGVIGVDSKVGVGSIFWIELDAAAAPAVVDSKLADTLGAAPERPARTVLYVEDNPANLQLVQRLLVRRPELRLLTAVNAALGVALARVEQPDVILMDISLPGISGIEALALLRADRTTAHIPVLAVSANAMPDDIARGLAAGFERYLTKPIAVEGFMAALDAALIRPTPGAAA